MTAPRWWRGISARSARAPKSWTWTTIWRSWRANPGRCPVPPRWRRPAQPRCSPPSTKRGGAAARKAHGDAAGTRALVEVLLLHRHLDRADVVAGISAALSVGSTNVDVVALEARKAAERRRRRPWPPERHQDGAGWSSWPRVAGAAGARR